jgi:hypothetical protein
MSETSRAAVHRMLEAVVVAQTNPFSRPPKDIKYSILNIPQIRLCLYQLIPIIFSLFRYSIITLFASKQIFTAQTHPEENEDMRKALVASIVAFGMAFSAPAFAGGSHHGGGGTKIGAGLGAKLGVGVKGLAKVKVKVGLRLGIGIGL